MRLLLAGLFGALPLALCEGVACAQADDKAACVAAADAAQVSRSGGRLREARSALLVCARESCPAIVRTDCSQWLTEVEVATPTVVLRVHDQRGRDLTDVRVLFDDQPLTHRLDGLPLALDPGAHRLFFQHAGKKPHLESVVVHTGEKNRPILIVMQDVDPPPPVAVAPVEPEEGERSPWVRPLMVGAAVVGVGALGAFSYLGVTGTHKVDSLRTTCAPHCSKAQVDDARDTLLWADLSLSLGVVASATAISLLLWSDSPAKPAPNGAVTVGPIPGGAAALLRGWF